MASYLQTENLRQNSNRLHARLGMCKDWIPTSLKRKLWELGVGEWGASDWLWRRQSAGIGVKQMDDHEKKIGDVEWIYKPPSKQLSPSRTHLDEVEELRGRSGGIRRIPRTGPFGTPERGVH